MTTTLIAASRQWAERPADETYDSLPALHGACVASREASRGSLVNFSSLRVEAAGGRVQLVGRTEKPAHLTHWAFGQVAQRAGAPAAYLRGLPATLASQNLNHGLAQRGARPAEEDKARLLFSVNGALALRAVNTDSYSRIWNSDITERLLALVAHQPYWHAPKAYDRHAGKRGTPDANGMVTRGLYASDRDMFAFMVDEGRPLCVDGAGNEGIRRGFFVWNSEVGASSFGICTFIYDFVCGNHYVWGAKDVVELRIRHVGSAELKAWSELTGTLRNYAESSTGLIEGQIRTAQRCRFGVDKNEVLDRILGRRIPELSRKVLSEAYDTAAQTPRYGDPRTAWAMASGLTELSQAKDNTDDRLALDRAAGRLIEMAF